MTEIPPAADLGDGSTMAAAFAYIRSGLYVGPLRQRTKNPGSMLGKGWHAKTFNDAESVATWFAGVDLGLFLHCGRSGLVVLDIDAPEEVPAAWWPLLDTMPFQRSRPSNGRRGHYVAQVPPGRRIGNSIGRARKGWGEVRGENGVVALAPTRHEKADEGAAYEWMRSGPIPVLPDLIADLLPGQVGERTDAASDAAVRAFRGGFSVGSRPSLAQVPLGSFARAVANGGSRHVEAVRVATWMAEEVAAGLYASDMLDTLESMFRGSYSDDERRRHRGDGREWGGILAWAVGRVTTEKVAEIKARFPAAPASPELVETASVVESLTADASMGWDALWS